MEFIDRIKQEAKQNIKTIVLPEGNDIRVLEACGVISKEKFAKVVVLGNKEQIEKDLKENNIIIDEEYITIIDNSEENEKLDFYSQEFYNLRKHKGMTLENAREILKTNSRYFASLMVKMGDADGFVSGASNPTADTLRPALQIIKSKKNVNIVSAFCLMDLPDKEFGEDGVLVFADVGMNENPTAEELSEIAINANDSLKELVNENATAKIAMLSYSTNGSAKSELTEKVATATKLAKEKRPDLLIEGEMQLDAAVIPEIAVSKFKDTKIKGKANILIFPDLNAGNIGYKLTQRFGKAKAYGPLCQGFAKPVNDLSRGCSMQDIVGVVAITAVQAQKLN